MGFPHRQLKENNKNKPVLHDFYAMPRNTGVRALRAHSLAPEGGSMAYRLPIPLPKPDCRRSINDEPPLEILQRIRRNYEFVDGNHFAIKSKWCSRPITADTITVCGYTMLTDSVWYYMYEHVWPWERKRYDRTAPFKSIFD